MSRSVVGAHSTPVPSCTATVFSQGAERRPPVACTTRCRHNSAPAAEPPREMPAAVREADFCAIRSSVIADSRLSAAGSSPDRPLFARSRAVTLPRESLSTPCHPPTAGPDSQPPASRPSRAARRLVQGPETGPVGLVAETRSGLAGHARRPIHEGGRAGQAEVQVPVLREGEAEPRYSRSQKASRNRSVQEIALEEQRLEAGDRQFGRGPHRSGRCCSGRASSAWTVSPSCGGISPLQPVVGDPECVHAAQPAEFGRDLACQLVAA